ncbi:MAG: hypothetical protein Q7R43_00155 [Candidatus Daviesbacteria bacterium]|nr:hypothetical protein [Candidatus Daviesbacteria bacterium]
MIRIFPHIKRSWIIFFLAFTVGVGFAFSLQRINFNKFLPWSLQPVVEEIEESQQQKEEFTVKFMETSPNGQNDIVLYERPFIGRSDLDYKNYLANQYFFVVRESGSQQEHYIYVGNYKVGYPHWLGNDFIFFTTGCGTGCRGLEFVNINSRESKGAVITTTPISKDGYETNFRDWFSHEYNFSGYDKNLRSVYLGDKAYLIFEMWNNNQSIGEKRFIFTGNSLEEQ